jgi:hypothetical protein
MKRTEQKREDLAPRSNGTEYTQSGPARDETRAQFELITP